MKVLFISNYYDGTTGWSHAAQNYIMAMDAAGINIVPRPIKLNSVDGQVPQRIRELEQQSTKDCNIVIQKVLPHMMTYDGNFEKNIGLFVTETNSFRDSSWPQYLNMMDEVWVPSKFNIKACENSGIIKPVRNFPEPVNKNKFLRGYQPLDIPEAKQNFTFYFIGENIKRKNLYGLLEAFHLEFRPYEPVHLVIKTHMGSLSPDDTQQHIQNMIQDVKRNLKLYKDLNMYKKETLIVGHMSDEEICRLHATCDCLVAPSFGEAWCIPCQEAMLFGNTPIYTEGLGMDDYCGSSLSADIGGMQILSVDGPSVGTLDTFPDLCTGREDWKIPLVQDLRVCMREIYENVEYRNKLSEWGMNQLSKYSYKYVGQQIKKRLEKIV